MNLKLVKPLDPIIIADHKVVLGIKEKEETRGSQSATSIMLATLQDKHLVSPTIQRKFFKNRGGNTAFRDKKQHVIKRFLVE